MSSLFRRGRGDDREREPLLPRHNHETDLQASLHEKLHTYQILRALSRGYLPSNEQLVAQLRRATDVLRTVPPGMSATGKELILSTIAHLESLIGFFEDKNSGDQIQDFLWYITKARLSLDAEDLGNRLQELRPRAELATGGYSLTRPA